MQFFIKLQWLRYENKNKQNFSIINSVFVNTNHINETGVIFARRYSSVISEMAST